MFKPSDVLNKKYLPVIISNTINLLIIVMASKSISSSAAAILENKTIILSYHNYTLDVEKINYSELFRLLEGPITSSITTAVFIVIFSIVMLVLIKFVKLKNIKHLKWPIITITMLCIDIAAVGAWEHERDHYYTVTTTATDPLCGRSSSSQVRRLEGQHDDPKSIIARIHDAEASPGFKSERSFGQLIEGRLVKAYYLIRYGVEL